MCQVLHKTLQVLQFNTLKTTYALYSNKQLTYLTFVAFFITLLSNNLSVILLMLWVLSHNALQICLLKLIYNSGRVLKLSFRKKILWNKNEGGEAGKFSG